MELSNLRTLTSKTRLNEDNSFTLEAHVGPIHYFNKLGVGDGQVRYREIDWTLIFDDKKRGWGFQYNNYHPFIPEFADQWMEFRDLYAEKDQVTRFKARAYHVKGRIISPEELGIKHLTGTNCVIYDDAFGKGRDYIVYFTRTAMAKVIRIREEYKPKQTAFFDIEVEFPENANVYRKSDKSEYKLEFTSDKDFDSEKQILIGNNSFTYIRSFSMWDSETKVLGNVGIVLKDNKKFIRKTIPSEFLNSSIGDIFTDDQASPFAMSGDGFIICTAENGANSQGAWETFVASATGTAYNGGNRIYAVEIARELEGDNFEICRSFFPFDTSAIPADAEVTDANLYLYVTDFNADYTSSGYAYATVYKGTQASTSSLIDADFNNFQTTACSANFAYTGFTLNQYATIALNSTDYSNWLVKEGYTKLCIREGHDSAAILPESLGDYYNNFTCDGSETNGAGTTTDPQLVITYDIGSRSSSLSASASSSQSPSSSISRSTSPSLSASSSASPSVGTDTAFVGAANADAVNTSITVDKPAGVVNGDLLFLHIYVAELGYTPTPPAGWTLLQSFALGTTYFLYWKLANDEGANYTWSVDSGPCSLAATVVAYRYGFNPVSPIQTSSNYDYHVNNTSLVGGILTTVNAGQTILLIGGAVSETITFTKPTSLDNDWVEDVDVNSSTSGYARAIYRCDWSSFGETYYIIAEMSAGAEYKHAFSVALNTARSTSASASPSPSAGYQGYSRGVYVSLPSGVADLTTLFSAQDVSDVGSDNNVLVSQLGDSGYVVHQFKDFAGANTKCIISWTGKTTLPASASGVTLQIYKVSSATWETIATNTSAPADTKFTLSAGIANLTNYKSGGVITCRVWQQGI